MKCAALTLFLSVSELAIAKVPNTDTLTREIELVEIDKKYKEDMKPQYISKKSSNLNQYFLTWFQVPIIPDKTDLHIRELTCRSTYRKRFDIQGDIVYDFEIHCS